MALEVRTQGIVEVPIVRPVLANSALDLQAVAYSMRPFGFQLSLTLKYHNTTRAQIREEATGTGGHRRYFSLPINRPTNNEESWRIGIVQNVVGRKATARWGSSSSSMTTVIDLHGRRLLDTAATSARPFVYDPRPRFPDGVPMRIPRAVAPGMSGAEQLPEQIHTGFDLFVYPNGVMSEQQDPAIASAPRQYQSNDFLCEFDDVPGGIVPLHCNGEYLREFRSAQTQQWFLALSRGGRAFESLLVSSVFTTYFYIRINPPARGRSFGGPSLLAWGSLLVPWDESLESFPSPSSPNPELLSNWRSSRWQEIRRAQPWARRQRNMEVMIGTPQQMY